MSCTSGGFRVPGVGPPVLQWPFQAKEVSASTADGEGTACHSITTHFLMYYACPLSIFLPDNGKATKARSHGRPVLHVQSVQFNG